MMHRLYRCTSLLILPALLLPITIGCGGGANALPSKVTVLLPDGTSVEVDRGSGVPSLADTTWSFSRTAGNAQSAVFATVVFDENGALARFEDSTIAAEIFGSTLHFDGQNHNTTQSGVQYVASTYGAESADQSGFSFEGRLKAFAAGIEVASGTASATAEYDPDDPNIVRGTFTFSTRVTIASIPEGNTDDEFSFMGQRINGE